MGLLLQGLFSLFEQGVFIVLAGLVNVSSGRWVSANLQKEPPSLCTEREGDQWVLCLF